jgi:ABC-type antimicrobial peptide transport system permease subunit
MVLTGLGIALAASMLSAALTVGDGLGRGFDRGARAADLPDVIVRFDPIQDQRVAQRIQALPDIAAFSLRQELTDSFLSAGGHSSSSASVELVRDGRRGYAIIAGRDLSGRFGEVVVEKGLAQQWGIHLGSVAHVGDLALRVVGLAEAPDNVSYPLAVPRVYVSLRALSRHFGFQPGDTIVDEAEIWLRDPRYIDEVLVQARATSFGIHGLRFVTRSGVRILLDQAAGIVIDLLVALSLIALVTAGVMLAASARAEVQRRLGAIGVRRAVGAARGHIAITQGLEAVLVAGPAATVGTAAGTLATYGPSGRLLTMLNEPPPGTGLILPLLAGWATAVVIPVLAAAWPAWRAAGRPPVALLGGAELRPGRSRGRGQRGLSSGVTVLGARLVSARRARMAATAVTLGMSAGFVLLLLALASALQTLETDPGALGKRYQLTAQLPPDQASRVRGIPGVQAAAPRYTTDAADSFQLGESIDVIAYPGDHTVFEAPPLSVGRRVRGPDEAEVGAGLADALGLSPGSTLALAFASGAELRVGVTGIVSSLEHDGRVAYLPATALLRADPGASEQIAVKLRFGANPSSVSAALTALGAAPQATGGATARGKPLVDTLRTLLRAVAIVDGLVCVYALIQACALTIQERRRTVAVLRACGGGSSAVRRLLAGAAAMLVVPAAAIGILLELLVLGPALSHLAAGYATLPLGASAPEIAAVIAGLAVAAAVAVLWVARQVGREAVVTGLAS